MSHVVASGTPESSTNRCNLTAGRASAILTVSVGASIPVTPCSSSGSLPYQRSHQRPTATHADRKSRIAILYFFEACPSHSASETTEFTYLRAYSCHGQRKVEHEVTDTLIGQRRDVRFLAQKVEMPIEIVFAMLENGQDYDGQFAIARVDDRAVSGLEYQLWLRHGRSCAPAEEVFERMPTLIDVLPVSLGQFEHTERRSKHE